MYIAALKGIPKNVAKKRVTELFGKRQNNSKTSVNGNEAFPQTSMKVYLKTDVTAKKVLMKPFVKAYLKKQQARYVKDLARKLKGNYE